jgi:hypothetical protein
VNEVEEKLKEKLGEKYQVFEEFLEKDGLDIIKLYKLEPQERIKTVAKFCEQNGYDFPDIYSRIETAKDETMKEYALRSAVTAILVRDGPAAINDLNFYRKIQEKVKELEEK